MSDVILLLYLCQVNHSAGVGDGHAHQADQEEADHAQLAVPQQVGAGHAHLVNEVGVILLLNLYELCIFNL